MMKVFKKGASIISTNLKDRDDTFITQLIADMQNDLLPGFKHGHFNVFVGEKFKLSNVSEAINEKNTSTTVGKTILINDL